LPHTRRDEEARGQAHDPAPGRARPKAVRAGARFLDLLRPGRDGNSFAQVRFEQRRAHQLGGR
jgi:hypothetical protein